MIHLQPPAPQEPYDGQTSVFLAGSIEMGVAENWQQAVVDALSDTDLVVFNPRREGWDSSWVQSIENPQFRAQVEWELDGLARASCAAFYFSPGTRAPVTLMELGLQAGQSPEKLVVCCPEGFWRKGNVDVLCARYGVEQAPSLDDLISAIRRRTSCKPSSSMSPRPHGKKL